MSVSLDGVSVKSLCAAPVKLAVMQPYFFPYLGYFQLIHAVDNFVVYDDVQYMKGGWINRNRILINGQPAWISLPIEPGSTYSQICERKISDREFGKARIKILGQLHAAYRRAPHYSAISQMVEEVLDYEERSVPLFILNSLEKVSQYLGIGTKFQLSSALDKADSGLCGKERVFAICKAVGATTYINAIGGRDLYHEEDFAAHSVDLRFIAMDHIEYAQGDTPFVPYLSIIDVLMFNDRATVQQYLQRYTLQM